MKGKTLSAYVHCGCKEKPKHKNNKIYTHFFILFESYAKVIYKESDLCARKIKIRKVKVQFWRRNNQMNGL